MSLLPSGIAHEDSNVVETVERPLSADDQDCSSSTDATCSAQDQSALAAASAVAETDEEARRLSRAAAAAEEAGEYDRADSYLAELADLADGSAETPGRSLILALNGALRTAQGAGERSRADALVERLRNEASSGSAVSLARSALAWALVPASNSAGPAAAAALVELRALARDNERESEIRAALAAALVNVHCQSGSDGNALEARSLLDEVRALAAHQSSNADVRSQLARALFNASIDAARADETTTRLALIDELRTMCSSDEATDKRRSYLGKVLLWAMSDSSDRSARVAYFREILELGSGEALLPIRMQALYRAQKDERSSGRGHAIQPLLDELEALATRPEATAEERLEWERALFEQYLDVEEAAHQDQLTLLKSKLLALETASAR